jgi:DNA-binding NtrC family response regulator
VAVFRPARVNDQDSSLGSVLIVEDEVLIRLDHSTHLRDAGLTVFEAATADERLTILHATASVGLVISDIRTPGNIDGLDLPALRPEAHCPG